MQAPETPVAPTSSPSPAFSINEWFNENNIRMLGTPDKPYFYAADVGRALGIAKIAQSISRFGDSDTVSDTTRTAEGIVTYRQYRNELRRNDGVKLLTEAGVYRLIMTKNTEITKSL